MVIIYPHFPRRIYLFALNGDEQFVSSLLIWQSQLWILNLWFFIRCAQTNCSTENCVANIYFEEGRTMICYSIGTARNSKNSKVINDTDACVWVYCLPILLHVMGVQMISIHTNKLQNRKINFIRINGMLLSAFLWFAAGVLSYTKLHSPLEYKWIVWIAFLYLIGHLQCSHSLILCYRRPLLIVMIRRVFLSHRCAQTAIIPFILHWRIPII